MRRNRSEEVADHIREYILANAMTPGRMLPSIERLAKRFQVSKGTVREALTNLASAGVVEIKQGSGTCVAEPKLQNMLAPVVWRALLERVTSDEIIQARIAVESSAIAAAKVPAAEVDNLRHLDLEMASAAEGGDLETYVQLDRQWHHSIAKRSGNRLLAEFTSLLHQIALHTPDREHLTRTSATELRFHKQIADALRTRDTAKAKALLVQHIEQHSPGRARKGVAIYCDVLGTGSVGGSFYTIGQRIVRMLERYSGFKPTVYATGGGIENLHLTHSGHIGLSIVQADVAMDAYSGRGDSAAPFSDLRSVCALPGLELQIVTLESSGIESIADLRGKVVAMGARGGASSRIADEVLTAHGLEKDVDYTSEKHPIMTAVHMILKGSVDAVCFLSMGQSEALVELACQAPTRLLPLDDSRMHPLLMAHPMWYACTIEAATYPRQMAPVRTVGVPTILVSHRDIAGEDVAAIASALIEHGEEIGARVNTNRGLDGEPLDIMGIPLHHGVLASLAQHGMARSAS